MNISKVTAVLFLLASGVAQGETSLPPPAWPVPDIRPSKAKTQPVTGVAIGSFQVTFEKTTFKDVIGTLGDAPISHQGEAGEFLMWVCYTVPSLHSRVWLTSSELGGEEYIDGMVAKRIQDAESQSPQCPVALSHPTALSIDNGLWLGSTVKRIEGILGPPNRASASVIYYPYEGKVGDFDITSVLVLRISKGRVIELHATHSATN